ncbi:hypothetical protein RF11_07892 [Thelohanellus kitauei]|uniref:Uncharacterized protein n=1 Tax=Thelohanellus kitauei TaxID=669202 RepID=A0A0C2MNK8_THEKT|nr:hypothetical protein RF11_07892 [Thelohanellus kitauei]
MCSPTADRRDVSRSYSVTNTPRAWRLFQLLGIYSVTNHLPREQSPLNTSYPQLAEITGLPKCTISPVLRQESHLREELILKEGQAGTFKRKLEGKDPDVG